MFPRKTRILTAFAALACFGAAHAEGLYVGGAIGVPDYHDPVNGIAGSGNGAGLKVYGGWSYSPNFSLEAGYFDLGHIDNANGSVNTRGLSLDAVGRYEFAPRWSLLGSAGLADARFSTSRGRDWSPGIKLGVGAQYDITPTMALRIGYDRYHFTSAFDDNVNVGQTTVGLKFGF